MTVSDLKNELNIPTKEIITFLKGKDFKISSHRNELTDEMVALVRNELVPALESKKTEPEKAVDLGDILPKPTKKVKKKVEEIPTKSYNPDDMIPCKSVVPWQLVVTGIDKNIIYQWGGFGDVEYVSYRDLQFLKRKSIIKNSKIVIEDPDLCYAWRHELGEMYKHLLTVDYPEEFFDLTDDKFELLLKNASETLQEVIKFTAMDMIRNENYPTIQKLTIIDDVLGTCIKEFI